MKTYHLKDKKLEQRALEIDPDFLGRLQKEAAEFNNDVGYIIVNLGPWTHFDRNHDSHRVRRFAMYVTREDLDERPCDENLGDC